MVNARQTNKPRLNVVKFKFYHKRDKPLCNKLITK